MADYLSEADVEDNEKAECIDKFILNTKFLGLLKTIAGSERITYVDQAIEEIGSGPSNGDKTLASVVFEFADGRDTRPACQDCLNKHK